MSCRRDYLTEKFLHVVLIVLKAVLGWQQHLILGSVIVRNACAVTLDADKIVTDVQDELVNLGAVGIVLDRQAATLFQ